MQHAADAKENLNEQKLQKPTLALALTLAISFKPSLILTSSWNS